MALNAQQLATLKTFVGTVPEWVALPNDSDTAFFIAAELNKPSNPAFVVYKSNETVAAVGQAVNYVAFEALTTANLEKINTFTRLNMQTFPPSKADVRSFWANVFSGALGGQGQATRDALEALWRRVATLGEKVYATGTGTTLAPGMLVVEGNISPADVQAARNLP